MKNAWFYHVDALVNLNVRVRPGFSPWLCHTAMLSKPVLPSKLWFHHMKMVIMKNKSRKILQGRGRYHEKLYAKGF